MVRISNQRDVPQYLSDKVAKMITGEYEGWFGDSEKAENCTRYIYMFAHWYVYYLFFERDKSKSLMECPQGEAYIFTKLFADDEVGGWWQKEFVKTELSRVIDVILGEKEDAAGILGLKTTEKNSFYNRVSRYAVIFLDNNFYVYYRDNMGKGFTKKEALGIMRSHKVNKNRMKCVSMPENQNLSDKINLWRQKVQEWKKWKNKYWKDKGILDQSIDLAEHAEQIANDFGGTLYKTEDNKDKICYLVINLNLDEISLEELNTVWKDSGGIEVRLGGAKKDILYFEAYMEEKNGMERKKLKI